MKIGLFFGSFNPMHIGHKVIASYMVEFSDLDRVCFVVSPQNPHKEKNSLLHQHHRLMIIKSEIEDNPTLQVSDVEFTMPKPSYTIDTLLYLTEKHPNNEYALIMGADNFQNFHKWKNYEEILNGYHIYIYPRKGFNIPAFSTGKINIIEGVPQMDISASFIRKSIRHGREVSYLVPEKAWKYIEEMNFYK